ncbi:response regulator transcription factor [Pontixanthobacter aquaemixtae]|uniref:Response regulator n=1 Tax=Pontixanthobacter aquaemixtae TaxID=1958940 RepID=A0A844ZZW8_9SPHN|nr:response regulator transcription factor [Pontixanthobacter aquaemixtae]MXO90979.1 response regulator [Pontixanthobacter aquaemixtae]
MRVAVADDDPEILDQITGMLEGSEHQCDKFQNGQDLIVALKRETYDVVLLDWNMPQATGIDVIEWAGEALKSPPAFILMTSRSGKSDVVRGLKQGASDYIIKPETAEVVIARIEAAGRRLETNQKPRHNDFGNYKIDRLKETIEVNGETPKLTAREFKVAALFFDNLNRPLSRNYIFLQVWGGNVDLETRTLDMHVSRIRSKLALRPENGFAIQTVFGFGYRMDAFENSQ